MAKHLLLSPAQEPAGAGIPTGDVALLVGADDGGFCGAIYDLVPLRAADVSYSWNVPKTGRMIASQRAEKNKALMRQTRRLFLLMEVPAAAQYLYAPQQETPSLLITDHPAHPHPAFGGLRLVLDFGELLRVGWRRSHPPRTMH